MFPFPPRFAFLMSGVVALAAAAPSVIRGETVSPPAPESAPPAEAKPSPPSPEVTKVGETGFKVGLVEFDGKTREIRFPAVVNMHQGMIEFPIVHKEGRVHEAIFATEALPLHVETALRLLRYKPSKEVFPTYPGLDVNNPPPYEEWPPAVYPPSIPEARLQILVSWGDKPEKNEPVDIRTMLYRTRPDAPENAGDEGAIRFDALAPHWIFTGSTEKMGSTVESLGGSILGIRPESECSINAVADEAVHELEWFADPKRVPEPDTKVTIHIRPVAATAAQPTPSKPSPQDKKP